MSKELLKTAFDKMKNMSCCSLQLIKIKSGKTGISYYTRECELTPPGKIGSFAHELADKYSKAIEDGEYYGAAEPPVRCGEIHLSGLTEPPHFVY